MWVRVNARLCPSQCLSPVDSSPPFTRSSSEPSQGGRGLQLPCFAGPVSFSRSPRTRVRCVH
jgi:hypothetical protein